MNSTVFGELIFNTGWKTKTSLTIYGRSFEVTVKAKAYFEQDSITKEQGTAFSDFSDNKNEHLKTIEKLLNKFANGNAPERFVPRTLLFQRDGSYALLLDDKEDEDGGVAVCFSPKTEVVLQDEYL
jgi:hypothetical protein